MKPEVDVVLRSMMTKLLLEVAPAVGDAYVRSNVEAMGALLAAAAEEFDRAAEVRVAENRSMREILRARRSTCPRGIFVAGWQSPRRSARQACGSPISTPRTIGCVRF